MVSKKASKTAIGECELDVVEVDDGEDCNFMRKYSTVLWSGGKKAAAMPDSDDI